MDEVDIQNHINRLSNELVKKKEDGFVMQVPFTWITLKNSPDEYLPFVNALIQNNYSVKIEPEDDGEMLKISITDDYKR